MSIKDVPIDINEGMIVRHRVKVPGTTREFVNDPQLARLTTATAVMRQNAEKAKDLAVAIKADKSFMGSAAATRFGNDAQKLFLAASAKIDEAMRGTFAELDRLHKIVSPPVLMDKALASEIRSRLSKLSVEDRLKVIDAGDDTVMSTLANAPAFLSGMTSEERDMHAELWSAKKFPEETGRKRRLVKAVEDAVKISKSGDSYFRDLTAAMNTPTVTSSARVKYAQDRAVEAATAE